MSESQEEIEQHNATTLWREVESHLTDAKGSVEQAQGCLEDLGEGGFADQLQALVDTLSRAATDAAGR